MHLTLSITDTSQISAMKNPLGFSIAVRQFVVLSINFPDKFMMVAFLLKNKCVFSDLSVRLVFSFFLSGFPLFAAIVFCFLF